MTAQKTPEQRAVEIVNSMRDPLDKLSTNPNHWQFAIAAFGKECFEAGRVERWDIAQIRAAFERASGWSPNDDGWDHSIFGAKFQRELHAPQAAAPEREEEL